jgi:hypothetical protein
MKAIAYFIEDCIACPYCEEEGYESMVHKCKKAPQNDDGYPMVKVFTNTLPEWCPLEDVSPQLETAIKEADSAT